MTTKPAQLSITAIAFLAILALGCGGGDTPAPPSGETAATAAGSVGATAGEGPTADTAGTGASLTTTAATDAAADTAAECPAATRITTLDGGPDWAGSGPHDLTGLETVTARWRSDKELQLVIASAPIDGVMRTFEWLDPPVTGKDWVLRLKFLDTDGQVDAGTYGPAVMPYKPRRMSFDLGYYAADGKGRRDDPGFREGTAEITALTADRVCGRFDLSGKDGAEPHFEGEFVAPILAR